VSAKHANRYFKGTTYRKIPLDQLRKSHPSMDVLP